MAALAEKHYTVGEGNIEKLAAKLSSKRERKRGIHGLQKLTYFPAAADHSPPCCQKRENCRRSREGEKERGGTSVMNFWTQVLSIGLGRVYSKRRVLT